MGNETREGLGMAKGFLKSFYGARNFEHWKGETKEGILVTAISREGVDYGNYERI